MSELKFKMGTKSSTTPTTGNSGEVFFTTDENKYGHIYFIDKVKKVINIVPELLEVKFGGTGKATHTVNSVLVGNNTNAVKNIISNDGALYATGLNDEPRFGTLPVGQGGTGNTEQTANRLIYASSNDVLSSSDHYASSSKVSINSTAEPSGNHIFYVNGSSLFNGNIYGKSILPSEDMNSSYTVGNSEYTWYTMYARNLTLYDGTNGYTGGYIYTTVSSSTTANTSVVELGNTTATGTAGNRYGVLRLYNEGSTYLNLIAHRYAANGTTAATSRSIYLRDHGATAYLVATITKDQVGSGVKPVYVSTSGVLTTSTSTVGTATKPVYMSSGTITEGNLYAGGTLVTLNGTTIASSVARFYAPIASGSSGQILTSGGSGTSGPQWISILPIANGGTGASTVAGARTNLHYSAASIVTTTDDTVVNWAAKGPLALDWYSTASQITDQPQQYGFVLNVSKGTAQELHQLWFGQPSGALYHRGGNVSGWSGTWKKIIDETHVASTTAAGIVTTGTQSFAGTKTFTGAVNINTTLTIGNSSSNGGLELYHATPFIDFHFGKSTGDYTSRILESASGTLTFYSNINLVDTARQITRPGVSTSWVNGRTYAVLRTTSYTGYGAIASIKTTDGDWSIGTYTNNRLYFTYITDTNYNAGTNTTTAQMRMDPNGLFHASILCSSNHGTGTPGTSTAGVGTTGALYFKRV